MSNIDKIKDMSEAELREYVLEQEIEKKKLELEMLDAQINNKKSSNRKSKEIELDKLRPEEEENVKKALSDNGELKATDDEINRIKYETQKEYLEIGLNQSKRNLRTGIIIAICLFLLIAVGTYSNSRSNKSNTSNNEATTSNSDEITIDTEGNIIDN